MNDFKALSELVLIWAEDKGILDTKHHPAQVSKAAEEFVEFVDEAYTYAISRNIDKSSVRDIAVSARNDAIMELGDVLVTLVINAHLLGVSLEEALRLALDKITKRKGKTVDGVFVKEEDLT